jgi:hypothetical protein
MPRARVDPLSAAPDVESARAVPYAVSGDANANGSLGGSAAAKHGETEDPTEEACATEEEAARAVVDSLNVVMLAVYWSHRALLSSDRWHVAQACLWLLIGVVLAITEMICLMSMGIGPRPSIEHASSGSVRTR